LVAKIGTDAAVQVSPAERVSDEPDRAHGAGAEAVAPGRSGDLTALAYERIEDLFVSRRLPPGAFVRTQDIQTLVGLGRTPVHQAVRRLSAETLLEILPRNGLRITPVDLARERHLAVLRRDMIRFVTEAALRNLTPNARARLQYLRRQLQDDAAITLDRFNEIDKAFDILLIQASGERFLERTLRPLHAIARRAGHLHISRISGATGLAGSIAHHVAMMDGVLASDASRVRDACDALIDFCLGLIDDLEAGIDPHLLDAGCPALGESRLSPDAGGADPAR
jgi:DNA-binding GntR family transcriptional regulator